MIHDPTLAKLLEFIGRTTQHDPCVLNNQSTFNVRYVYQVIWACPDSTHWAWKVYKTPDFDSLLPRENAKRGCRFWKIESPGWRDTAAVPNCIIRS